MGYRVLWRFLRQVRSHDEAIPIDPHTRICHKSLRLRKRSVKSFFDTLSYIMKLL